MAILLLVLSGQVDVDSIEAPNGERPAAPVGALDETEQMLIRAQKGLMPSPRDRALAREYLDEWEDTGADDPALRRAFERVVQGAPPAGEQVPALARLQDNYRQARKEAIAQKEGRPGGGRRGRRLPVIGRIPGLRRYVKLALVAGVVFAIGIGGILAVRWRRMARR